MIDALNILVNNNTISSEVVKYLTDRFDDEEVFCFILNKYLGKDYSQILNEYQSLNEKQINESIVKIVFYLNFVRYSKSIEEVFKQLVENRCCSSEFLDLLKEHFSEEEIFCHVMIAFFNYKEALVARKLTKLSLNKIEANYEKVKYFVDEEDENIDPIPKDFKTISGNSGFEAEYYNGPRYEKLYNLVDDEEDLGPDWGYLDDIPNYDF